MAKEGKSSLTVFKYSTVSFVDIATNGKTIVCEEDSAWESSSDVSDRPTKCGVFRTPQGAVHTISGSGVNVGDLAVNEASAQDLKKLLDANTNLFFEYGNAVDGTIAAGELNYINGQGRFSDVNIQNNTGDGMSTFDWTFAVSGTVDLIP